MSFIRCSPLLFLRRSLSVVQSMGASREDVFDEDGDGGEDEESWEETPVAEAVKGKEDSLLFPLSVTGSPLFNGVRKNPSSGEVEITVKLAAR